MSKPMLVTVPFVLWLLDYWPLGRLKTDRLGLNAPVVLEKLPFLALAAVSSIITVLVQDRGGAVSSLRDYTLVIGNWLKERRISFRFAQNNASLGH